jgi:hypothetical protein
VHGAAGVGAYGSGGGGWLGPSADRLVFQGQTSYSCLTVLAADEQTVLGLAYERAEIGCSGVACRIDFAMVPV